MIFPLNARAFGRFCLNSAKKPFRQVEKGTSDMIYYTQINISNGETHA